MIKGADGQNATTIVLAFSFLALCVAVDVVRRKQNDVRPARDRNIALLIAHSIDMLEMQIEEDEEEIRELETKIRAAKAKIREQDTPSTIARLVVHPGPQVNAFIV
ncbi:hypothetical protein GGF32_006453 [Allomyces javanicus]|nr:hypothetical protein GGF32_006453 [Allomyces javanicus]